jgi:hypothetical protein
MAGSTKVPVKGRDGRKEAGSTFVLSAIRTLFLFEGLPIPTYKHEKLDTIK